MLSLRGGGRVGVNKGLAFRQQIVPGGHVRQVAAPISAGEAKFEIAQEAPQTQLGKVERFLHGLRCALEKVEAVPDFVPLVVYPGRPSGFLGPEKLGQHNLEVYGELLDMSDDEMSALAEKGVL